MTYYIVAIQEDDAEAGCLTSGTVSCDNLEVGDRITIETGESEQVSGIVVEILSEADYKNG